MKEIFKDIPDYEGLYQASSFGRIKSFERIVDHLGGKRKVGGGILKNINHKGYSVVWLCADGEQKKYLVHRLIAQIFISNPKNLPEVNHIDLCKKNNYVTNLEWINRQDNVTHAKEHGVYEHLYSPINQYDLSGNFIKKFESLSEATDSVVYKFNNKESAKHSIIHALNKRHKTAGGFIWRYAKK